MPARKRYLPGPAWPSSQGRRLCLDVTMTDRSAEECLDQAANGAKSSRCCASDRLETAREDQAECSLVSVMFAQKHARLRQSKRCAAGKTNEVLCRNRLYCASRDALVKRAC